MVLQCHILFVSLALVPVVCQSSFNCPDVYNHENNAASVISHVIDSCGTKRVVFVFDDYSDTNIALLELLSRSSIYYTFYSNAINFSHAELNAIVCENTDGQMIRPTTFLLTTSRFRDILHAAENHFHKVGRKRGSIAPHSTKWVAFVRTQADMESLASQQRNSTFDHVTGVYLDSNDTIVTIHAFVWCKNRVRTADVIKPKNPLGNSHQCAIFPNLKYGLNGRHLIMYTKVHWGFFVAIRNNAKTGQLEYHGYLFDIMNALMGPMNFTYTVLPNPADDQISWDAYAAITERGDMDLGLTVWSSSWTLIYNISVTYPVLLDTFSGIYRRHQPANEFNSFFIVCPFHPLTYVLLVASCAYTSLLYVFIVGFVYPHERVERFRPLGVFSVDMKKRCSRDASRVTIFKAMLQRITRTAWKFGASVMNQAYLPRPKQMSARVLLFLWSLAIVMFYAIYTGSLTAEMVVRPREAPFKSFKEMISRGDYRWGTFENSLFYRIMRSTKVGIIGRLNQSAKNIPDAKLGDIYQPLTDMVNNLDSDYVLIHFHSLLNQIKAVSKYPSHYNIIPESLFSANQGFVGPVNSELCEYFSVYIQKLHESGLETIIYNAYSSGNSSSAEEIEKDGKQRHNINLEDMRWPFSIVSFVLVLSLSVLVAEKLFALAWEERESGGRSEKK